MSKLKVFGGISYWGAGLAGQLRTVVAATSQKEAAGLVGIPLSQFREWWHETGNSVEISVAMSKPGAVFVQPLDAGDTPFVERTPSKALSGK